MQAVEFGPRKLAGANPVHTGTVPGAPRVSEFRPVHGEMLPPGQFLDFLRHRPAPVDDGAERVEDERFHRYTRLWAAERDRGSGTATGTSTAAECRSEQSGGPRLQQPST